MYWRFGHQNASVIDHLLENGNVSLEELLEQDDLIQECKAQNSKLIEYLREPAVLQQLLGYITSDDLEERARFKYPFIACEVIACEAWGIFESALSNTDVLVKFWEFLDRPPPLNPMQASYFAKVIGVFLMKRTNEMLQFIKSQPEVVPKLLLHMSTSAIMDLLLKIISMEESPEGKGTVQWLSEQGLMPWLVNRLDPNFDAEVHSIASQVLLDIIAISQSSHPEQPSIGTNVLIEELKSEVLVSQLVGFMLQGDAPYSSSTLINGVTIFIELIRRNNSDYDVEPLAPNTTEPVREAVDLSDLLKVLASRIEDFKELLIVPRSVKGPIDTSIGKQTPLGFERLKICEMFAELLHCSNMAVLNSHPIISVSPDGTVKVPTVALNTADNCNMSLRSGIVSNGKSGDTDDELGIEKNDGDAQKEGGEKNKRNSKAGSLHNGVSASTDSAENHAATTDDHTASAPHIITTILQSPIIASIYSNTNTPGDVLISVGDFLKLQFVDHRIIPTCFDLFFQFPWNNFLHTVVYDMVHQVFHRPMGDIGRSDLNGTFIPPKSDHDITEGWNRRLTISIFKDGQLTKRITDAQRLNDYECAQPKGVRLGYMGHLTYIADETVRLLELYAQTSLLSTLYEYIDMEDWWNYVSKILKETKERDAQVLGGSRPNMIESHKPSIDDGNDDDFIDDNDDEYGNGSDFIGGVGGHEGDVASDQFARYLCQQITNNLPDKFGSSDEDEDDEDGNWIGEYAAESEFDMGHAGAADGLAKDGMDFDSEDEDGVDEETWNAPWPVTSTEAKVAEQGSAAHSDTAPAEKPGEVQESLAESKTATPPGEESLKKEDDTTLSSTETKSEKTGHDTADQITSASPPAHTQTVHTSSISKDVNDNVSSAIDNDAFDQNGMGEITILPPASHVLDITEEHSTQSNTVAEEVADYQNPSSATNTNVKDVPASKGEEGLNAEGTLTDSKEPLSNTPSSPPKSTASTGSTQSISSTVVEPPTSPQSSTSSTELSPPATSIPNVASKQTVADSNTSNKKAEEGMEEEVTKVAEKVGKLDLEQRG